MPREGSGVSIVITPIPLASRERSRQEDSHSGRVRTLGKRVKGNLSRVQIPHPPLVSGIAGRNRKILSVTVHFLSRGLKPWNLMIK